MDNLILEFNYYLHTLFHNNTLEEKKLTKVMVKNQMITLASLNLLAFLAYYPVKYKYGILFRFSIHCAVSCFSICFTSYYNSRLLHMHVLLSKYPCEYFIIKSKSKIMGDFINELNEVEDRGKSA